MRCMNCGWENPENLAKCEKCNSPLGHHPVSKPEPEPERDPIFVNLTYFCIINSQV